MMRSHRYSRRAEIVVWISILTSLIFFAAACEEPSDQKDSSASVSRVERILAECAKISACTGQSANACFATVADTHSWMLFEGIWHSQEIELRAGCMAEASSCDQVITCIDEAHQTLVREQSVLAAEASCDLVQEGWPPTYCEDDLLVWCVYGEYDTEVTPLPVDLEEFGLTCNSTAHFAADLLHTACDDSASEVPFIASGCDGTVIYQCVDKERATTDCRDIDPDFVCSAEPDTPQNHLCAPPIDEWECERGNYTNFGDWGRCEGAIARICAGNKFYEVNCAAFPGASCVQEDNSTGFPVVFCRI